MSIIAGLYIGQLIYGVGAAEELAVLKAAIDDGSDAVLSIYSWWFIAIALIAVIAASYVLIRKKKYRRRMAGWVQITTQESISAVFSRAGKCAIDITLDIFHENKKCETLRGRFVGTKSNLFLIAELSSDQDNFSKMESLLVQVHLNFRPTPKEPMEYYQFTGRILQIEFPREKNWRIAQLYISWPKKLNRAQRREFMRLEISCKTALTCTLSLPPEEPVLNMDGLKLVTESMVLDISLGGALIVFSGAPAVKENSHFVGALNLPDLGPETAKGGIKVYLLLKVLSREILEKTAKNKLGDQFHTVVRTCFLGRYKLSSDGKQEYLKHNPEALPELLQWMQAYQRMEMQKEKALPAYGELSYIAEAPSSYSKKPSIKDGPYNQNKV